MVTCKLADLLKERGMTQDQLSRLTGIRKENISRLAHRAVVRRIECGTAVRICRALSSVRSKKRRKKIPVGLDALFPMNQR